MMLLLDENCRNLYDPLMKKGYKVEIAPEIIPILDGNKSVTDDQIIEYAKEHKTIIITYDKNLKLKAEKQGIPHLNPSSPEYQANQLDQEIKNGIMEGLSLKRARVSDLSLCPTPHPV